MDWITTTTLLHDLRDLGNDAAWRHFVGRFRIPIVDFARAHGLPAADAEDVAQETLAAFAGAYRDGRYDRERGRLRSWLFGFAYRHVLKQRERLARADRPRAETELVELAGLDERTATDLWNERWERFLVEECVERARREFSAETFRAFELVVLGDLSPVEAAQEMGVPVKKVYNGKHRVLARMRALRAELEGEHGDAVP